MTSQKEHSEHGKAVAKGTQARTEGIKETAQKSIAKARSERTGQFLAKVSDEQWLEVLERIEHGDIEANICRDLGINGSSIIAKRKREPEFQRMYDEAIYEGFIRKAKNIEAVTRGIEGFSTGDIRRDELVAAYDFKLASKFAAKILGDRLQIDQQTINIHISGSDEWGGSNSQPSSLDDIDPQISDN